MKYLVIGEEVFANGIVNVLGNNRFVTLLAIASKMDSEGKSVATLTDIGNLLGVHKNTVQKYVSALEDVKVNGEPLITRVIENKGKGRIKTTYTLNKAVNIKTLECDVVTSEELNKLAVTVEVDRQDNKCLNDRENVTKEAIIYNNNIYNTSNNINTNNTSNKNNNTSIKKINNNIAKRHKTSDVKQTITPKAAIKHFKKVYREVYGVNYEVQNYVKAAYLMKHKVISVCGDLTYKVIETAIKEYDKRWKTARYTRPTISMFSWVVNQVLDVLSEQERLMVDAKESEKKFKEVEEQMLAKLNKFKQK